MFSNMACAGETDVKVMLFVMQSVINKHMVANTFFVVLEGDAKYLFSHLWKRLPFFSLLLKREVNFLERRETRCDTVFP